MYALRESGEAYRRQFDSKNEALTPENTLSWRELPKLRQLSVVPPRHRSDHSLKDNLPDHFSWP